MGRLRPVALGILSPLRPARASTTIKKMANRPLCGVLILLFLLAPLSAAYCEKCTAGGCDLEMMANRATVHVAAESAAEEPAAGGHCPQAQQNAEDPALCLSPASMTMVADCCAMTAGSDSGESALLVIAAALDLAVGPSGTIEDVPAVQPQRWEGLWRQPQHLPPQPLYTLHSAFLI